MRRIIYFLVFCVLFNSYSQNETKLDSLEKKLVNLALSNNSLISMGKLKVSSAHKDVELAKNSWGEQVVGQINLNESHFNDAATNGLNLYYPLYLIGFRWSLSSFLKTPLTIKKAKIDEQIIVKDNEIQKQNLIYEVKRRFRIYVAKKDNLLLRKQLVDEAKSQLNIVSKKYNNKEVTFEEYLKMSNSYITLKESLNITESEMFVAKYNLEELVGVDVDNID